MWDGKINSSRIEAEETMQKYRNDGFEVELAEEGGGCFLFTRRVVKEAIIEGKPI